MARNKIEIQYYNGSNYDILLPTGVIVYYQGSYVGTGSSNYQIVINENSYSGKHTLPILLFIIPNSFNYRRMINLVVDYNKGSNLQVRGISYGVTDSTNYNLNTQREIWSTFNHQAFSINSTNMGDINSVCNYSGISYNFNYIGFYA